MLAMFAMLSWCHACHVSNYVMHSITMNDRCLVGWMVTDDSILGTIFMAIHMMEVLKELSPAAIGMFSFFLGGGGGGEGGFIGPVEVPFATPSMGGALTCCLGVGAFLDRFGGVVSSLRSSCLDRFEDSTLVS